MSRTRSVLSLIVVVLATTAPAARAGGWWNGIQFPETVAAGDTIEFTDEVLFETIESAERASNENYYAYLIEGLDFEMVEDAMSRDFDPNWWRPGDADFYQAGTVSLHESSSNLVDATIHLEIPQVDPGTYALMLCSSECTKPFADVIPSEVTVAVDGKFAALSRKVEYLRSRVSGLRLNLRTLGRDLRRGLAQPKLQQDVTAVERRLARLQGDAQRSERGLENLENRVEALERADNRMALGWLGVGGLLVGVVAWRMKKDRRSRRSLETLEGEAATPWPRWRG